MNDIGELIQVGAVVIAMLEDDRFGEAHALGSYNDIGEIQVDAIFPDLTEERFRQDAKWGPQHHSKIEWAMILTEEVGEWAEEILKMTLPTGEMSAAEGEVLRSLIVAGKIAKRWVESHGWNERQQAGFTEESK